MTLTEQVFAQSLLLAGDPEPRQEELLKLLCSGAVNSLTARLREGLRPEDCLADFVDHPPHIQTPRKEKLSFRYGAMMISA